MRLWAALFLIAAVATMVGCAGVASTPGLHQASVNINSKTPIVGDTSPVFDFAIDKSMYVKFSHEMDASTINSQNIYIVGAASTVTYDARNRIAYLKPAKALSGNTRYTVVATSNVRSANGTPMPLTYTYAVTTRTTPNQSIPWAEDVNGECVAINGPVLVKFSEPMASATINSGSFLVTDAALNPVSGTISYDSMTHIASFVPDAAFAYGTTYHVTIKATITDLSGTPMAADYTFSFNTCAQEVPPGDEFCTYTKGGYQGGGTPGNIFDTYYVSTFTGMSGLTIGNTGSNRYAHWDASVQGGDALQAYLTSPAGGASTMFPTSGSGGWNPNNPTATVNGNLPEQTATLALNIYFSGAVPSMPAGFGDLYVVGTGTPWDGMKVKDIYAAANLALGGLYDGVNYSQLNDLVTKLNESWDDCVETSWAKDHLVKSLPQV